MVLWGLRLVQRKRRVLLGLLVGLILCGIGAEAGARWMHAADVPVVLPSEKVGYLAAPSQSGFFLRRYDWAFNEHGMGTARPYQPSAKTDALLIADSIVYGWPVYTQKTRLGAELDRISPATIWPIGADSWGLLNEIAWIDANPDVAASTDLFIFINNSGDFREPSRAKYTSLMPARRPALAIPYFLCRFLGTRLGFYKSTAQPPTDRWIGELERFASQHNVPIYVILYPRKDELADGWWLNHMPFHELEGLAKRHPNVHVVPIGPREGWSETYYRDPIHPAPAHNPDLARILKIHIPQLQ